MKTRFLFLMFLILIGNSYKAQYAHCDYTHKEFREFLKDTIHVVLLDNNPLYNERIKTYFESDWDLNSFSFVKESVFLNETYLEDNENKFFLYPVALTEGKLVTKRLWHKNRQGARQNATGPYDSYHPVIKNFEDGAAAIAIFQADDLHKSAESKKYIHVGEKNTLATYSIFFSYQDSKEIPQRFAKDLDVLPLEDQVEIGMMAMHYYLKARLPLKNNKNMFCNSYYKDMKEKLNKPSYIRRKKLLINEKFLDFISIAEIKEEYKYPIEIVSAEDYKRIISERNPGYAVLLTAPTVNGFLTTVLDFERKSYLYHDFGWGSKISQKKFKNLYKAVKTGKN